MAVHYKASYILACSALLLASCGGTDSTISNDELMVDTTTSGFVARFAPGDKVIPFPSNLLFTGSQDGTLNIPVADANNYADPQVALNALDGFSTVAPISTTFNMAVDPRTLTAKSVQLYQVTTNTQGVVTGIVAKLNYGTEFIASLSSLDASSSTLVISPLKPLKPSSSYLVALTSDIKSSDGRTATPDATYRFTKSKQPLIDSAGKSTVSALTDEKATALEPLRQLTNYQELALVSAGLTNENIALSWTFNTQSVGNVLKIVHDKASANASSLQAVNLGSAGPQLVNIYAGALTVPYYLKNADASPLNPLTSFWQAASGQPLTRYNSDPVKTTDQAIPLLLSVPKSPRSDGKPFPIVIFQHGITSNRTHMLALADTLAKVGIACVSIDLPLHGVAPSSPFHTGFERTFELDLVNNTTRAAGPDGVADDSGTHFINLSSLLTSRDNNRQAVADLFALYKVLANTGLQDSNGALNLDKDTIYFMGHSLGGMVGTAFTALEPNIKASVFASHGGGIAKLLDGSATFGPVIAAGLAAKGVTKGSATYESFLAAAQATLDSADPINYATASANNRAVMSFTVNNDAVIPNNVTSKAPAGTVAAPLSGTDPLVTQLGLSQISSSYANSQPLKVNIRYLAGTHSSVLDPTPNSQVTTSMHTAFASFFASQGTQVQVVEPSVVESN